MKFVGQSVDCSEEIAWCHPFWDTHMGSLNTLLWPLHIVEHNRSGFAAKPTTQLNRGEQTVKFSPPTWLNWDLYAVLDPMEVCSSREEYSQQLRFSTTPSIIADKMEWNTDIPSRPSQTITTWRKRIRSIISLVTCTSSPSSGLN